MKKIVNVYILVGIHVLSANEIKYDVIDDGMSPMLMVFEWYYRNMLTFRAAKGSRLYWYLGFTYCFTRVFFVVC
jgi:hypothetical protein